MSYPLKPLNSVLIKPAGPDCNLACDYCFYLEKAALFPGAKKHRMGEEVLEELVRQCLAQAGSQFSFGWQGGEPTLMGLPFFEKAVALQQQYGRGKSVGNGLQTNGLLIDDKWAAFLAKYNFLVGLSLDGPEHVHDRYRKDQGGNGTWAKVRDRARLMLDGKVAVNALSVVNDYSVQFPEEIYRFHKDLGLNHMQFIPVVEFDPGKKDGASTSCAVHGADCAGHGVDRTMHGIENGTSVLSPHTVPAEAFGDFLCKLFDLWLADFKEGIPTTSIRFFDSVFYTYVNMPPPECTLGEECGIYVVVEHNGEVYSCDFYVEPEWKLGNVMEGKLAEMLNSEKQTAFGRIKSGLPQDCVECEWLRYCRGGCPKDRVRAGADGKGLCHLCPSYKAFFQHAHPRLEGLARQWLLDQEKAREMESRARYEAQNQNPQKVGRNDPCPCGSGRKYKKCCGGNTA